ncbi:MAG: hypothetical protein QNJ58_04410 [Desulfobacterales bacterium]|nr:hypothetical protein [Desulfobacterales bacterium]
MRREVIFSFAAEPRKRTAGCKQGRQMKIRNHFVVGLVYQTLFYRRQLTKFNAILSTGLFFSLSGLSAESEK